MDDQLNNKLAFDWMEFKGWKPFAFQIQSWNAINKGYSGLINAPTGCGKTYAAWFGILQHYQNQPKKKNGLHALWITPLKALSKEIFKATTETIDDLSLDYRIALRTGDTSTKERAQQVKNSPQALITTPESVHLLLATKGYPQYFKNLEFVIVDEWHDLLGSKRGVMIELALAVLKSLNPKLKIWGISATIGNLDEAKEILLGSHPTTKVKMIKANIKKSIEVHTILPDTLEKFPWAGHLGIKMIQKVINIIQNNKTTLIFTNTRFQSEIWYQQLLEANPDFAGQIALHHGSLSESLRSWVENALHEGILKAVVCTSSLDLGVDFRPVDTVIQVGSPKGIARFLQRAGRSGHHPGAKSVIHFLPTHSLEILEGSALKTAIQNNAVESRIPFIRSFDLLIQFMTTLAVSEGFYPDNLYKIIVKTHCFNSITLAEFQQCLSLITHGGNSLEAYDEFHKVVILEDGMYKVLSRKVAMRHRMGMGVIVSNAMIQVKFLGGKYIGTIEEQFISKLNNGDAFWFSGRNLELIRIKDLTAFVKPSNNKNGVIPNWAGGRMPISEFLSNAINTKLKSIANNEYKDPELKFLKPLFEEQLKRSSLPNGTDLLIEIIETKEGFHNFFYPFQGKFVHDGMAAIIAYRLGKITPISFSIGINDYGFELLSDQAIQLSKAEWKEMFNPEKLSEDIQSSINTNEMARKIFREIASIAGLVFQGFPSRKMNQKHLQANTGLFFKVFEDYEPNHLLLLQSYQEIFDFQLEFARMHHVFTTFYNNDLVIEYPKTLTPFSFPIFAEVFREQFSNETLEQKLKKITAKMLR